MSIDIDTFSKRRRVFAFMTAITYFCYQTLELDMAAQLIGWTPGSGLSEIIERIGFGLFVLSFMVLFYSHWRLSKSNKQTRSAAYDDLVHHHLNGAIRLGFIVLMFTSFLLLILQQSYDISGEDTARIFATLALTVPYFRFAWLETHNT